MRHLAIAAVMMLVSACESKVDSHDQIKLSLISRSDRAHEFELANHSRSSIELEGYSDLMSERAPTKFAIRCNGPGPAVDYQPGDIGQPVFREVFEIRPGKTLRLKWFLSHVKIKGQACELKLTLEDGSSVATLFEG